MFLQRIVIKNTGPIDEVDISLPIPNGNPVPLLIVGGNGSGKSLVLAHIVNALVISKQELFDNVEVEAGRVYKYRTQAYIKVGKTYSFSKLYFEKDVSFVEWQLDSTINEFSKRASGENLDMSLNLVPNGQNSYCGFQNPSQVWYAHSLHEEQTCLFFPVNRFEEPAWLNVDALKITSNLGDGRRIYRLSKRKLICLTSLSEIKQWCLDLIFDRAVTETKIDAHVQQEQKLIYQGVATGILNVCSQILGLVLDDTVSRFDLAVGIRYERKLTVLKNSHVYVSDLAQLSTGQTQILTLFLSILRDCDLSGMAINSFDDVRGIVVIDEIDAHLSAHHQYQVLPDLISKFKNVQFIITTHSPLFLLGLRRVLGDSGVKIVDMPTGSVISPDSFSEFQVAYESMKLSSQFSKDIKDAVHRSEKPLVYVEGDIDIKYLQAAALRLNKQAVLEEVNLLNGDGFGNLSNIWRAFDKSPFPGKILLLFDCDVGVATKVNGSITKTGMDYIQGNPIKKGIENLFTRETILRAEKHKPAMIDYRPKGVKRTRGSEEEIPEERSINPNEKRNFCDWLCENGTEEEFTCFQAVFEKIESWLAGDLTESPR